MQAAGDIWGSSGRPSPPGTSPVLSGPEGLGQRCRRPGPHLSTTKAEALWLTEAECSAHRPPGSSRVWTV